MKKSIVLLAIALLSLTRANATIEVSKTIQSEVDTVKVVKTAADASSEMVNPESVFPRKALSAEWITSQDQLITEAVRENQTELLSLVDGRKISEDLSVIDAIVPPIAPLNISIQKSPVAPHVLKKKVLLTDSL